MEKDSGEFVACYPGRDFPSVSVTGAFCEQKCSHCQGRHLSGMVPADVIGSIPRLVGKEGILVSGGCDASGVVPLRDRVEEIAEASRKGQVNIHIGFSDYETIQALVDAGVHRFSVDIHQDPDVISKVLNLNRSPEEYANLLRSIRDAGGVAIPHLTLGFGNDDFMRSAFLIAEMGFRNVVLLTIVLGSGDFDYPDEDAVVDAVRFLMNLGLSVTLGCMRDRRMRSLEQRLLDVGVTRMANPSKETVALAESKGMRLIVEYRCCCIGL